MKFLCVIAACCLVYVSAAPTEVCSNEQLLAEFKKIVNESAPGITYLGELRPYPAKSCKQISEIRPGSTSGEYWIQPLNTYRPSLIYCEMEKMMCGEEGPWVRLAAFKMAEGTQQCPFYACQLVTSPRRLCRKTVDSGCSSVYFSNYEVPFKKVCGKMIGYQYSSPKAFYPYYANQQHTIDDVYVDGVSITFGRNPRQHIWTFAAAQDEDPANNLYSCPCANSISNVAYTGLIPEFIGDDYYCETGSHTQPQQRYYLEDPLWDGEGCGRLSTCCEGSMKPWFLKEFPGYVEDRIEVRICCNDSRLNADVLLETIELYVK